MHACMHAYDDDKILHYYRKNGTLGRTRGALYFANPGAKGLDEPDKTASGKPVGVIAPWIADRRRENHEDYHYAPLGNDVDSYNAFFHKWKHGGFPGITSDFGIFRSFQLIITVANANTDTE